MYASRIYENPVQKIQARKPPLTLSLRHFLVKYAASFEKIHEPAGVEAHPLTII